MARAPVYLRLSVSIQSWAIFWRKTASFVVGRPLFSTWRAISTNPSRAMRNLTCRPKPRARRSYIRVVNPTDQPLPTPPSTWDSCTRTLSKKTSLNSASPVICRKRLDRHSGQLHVEQEVGDPRVPGRVGIRAGQQHHPVRDVGEGGPDLLPVDHPVVAILDGPRLQGGQVGPGIGLRVTLAPDLLGGEDLRRIAPLLFLRAAGNDRRSGHPDPEDVQDRRRLREGHLLLEDHLLDERQALTSRLLRPGEADEPAIVEPALPVAEELVRLRTRDLGAAPGSAHPVARDVLVEPGPDALAEGFLFRGQ